MILKARSVWQAWWKRLELSRGRRNRGGFSQRRRERAPLGTAAVQSLEERVLLSTITVTSAADPSGAHSGTTLRDAINQANLAAGPDTIVFDPSLNGTAIKLFQGQLNITDSLTIRGNGAASTVINGQSLSRVLNVTGIALDLTLDSLTVTAGKTVTDLQPGAGIYFFSSGALNVLNSTISGNNTTGIGSIGAGIYATTGPVTLVSSTLSGNKTTGAIAGGAGIYSISGNVTLTDSTLTGNSTTGEQAFGGGISSAFADITLQSSTLVKNSTTGTYSSGGGIYSRSGAVTLTNSILALNTVKSGGFPDIFSNSAFGATFSANHSLIGNRQGLTLPPAPVGSPDANGNFVGTPQSPIDPKLGALASNGGPTQTMALLTGSPAIDHGGTTTLTLDQRGFVRVINGTGDMGAYEFGSSAPVGPTVTLSVSPATLAEAGGQSTITATLSVVSGLTTTVNLAFSGTATSVSDYSPSAAQIVIPAGQLTGTITLTAAQDALYEGNETVIVSIASVVNGNVGGAPVTATIVDDDTAPTVSLSLNPANMAEAAGQSAVTATLSAVSGLATTVNLGFAGTATNVSDYTRSATQIVIPAGQLTGTITLTAVQDQLVEGDETVAVSIASVVNGTASGGSVTATIVDDDSATLPTVALSLDAANMAEAGGQRVVTATLSALSAVDTTVNLGFAGTATNVSDYTRSATQIVIPVGQLTGTITLTAVQDTLFEGNETVVVSIASVVNGTAAGGSVTATVVDDDTAPTVSLSRSPANIAEAGGQSTVTATLSALSGLSTTVNLGFAGTATNVSDYSRSAAQIVIPAGQLTGTITLTAAQDSLFEGNETVVVSIASVVNGTAAGGSVIATVVDDDTAPTAALSLDAANMAEAGGQRTVTATLSAVSGLATTINLGFAGTATNVSDYTRSAAQIVIPAGQLTGTITLTAVLDSLFEGNETVIVSIASVVNGTAAGGPVTATIVDDDPAPIVSLDPDDLAEAGGQTVVTAELSTVSGLDTTITLGFSGTATFGTDYTTSATQVVIPAGQLEGSITLTAVQDPLYEGNESIVLGIASVINGTPTGLPVTVMILDDDPAPTVSLGLSQANLAEAGGQSTLTATLSAVSGLDTTVNLGFSGTADGTDYTASGAQIIIPAGQLTGSITLTAAQDALYEGDETVVVGISSVVNGTADGNSVTATIVDDDAAPSASLSLDVASMTEAGGQSTVTATLSAVSGLDTTINLQFSGTAVAGTDYSSSAAQIVIPAGQLTGTITLSAVDNLQVEPDKTVVVGIGTVVNGTAAGGSVTETIVDDDSSLTVALSVDPANMAEAGGQSTVTATLSAVSSLDTTVTLGFSGTATSGADYSPSATQIVIAAGQLTGSITLTASQDTVFEGNETVIVGITSVDNGTASGGPVTATIVDDDPAPTVSLSIKTPNMAEAGGKSTVTATLSSVATVTTTINLGFSGAATSGVDYTASATQIVIPAGQKTGSITLTALQDSVYEGNEKIVVGITGATNAVPSGVQQVTATIIEDDAAPTVSLSVSAASISEVGGQSVVTATLSAVSILDTTVTLAYSGTATNNTDYTRSGTQIVIPAGQLTGTVTLTAKFDTLVEGPETVVVDISKVTNALENGVQQKTVTIVDFVAPSVTLSVSAGSIAEAAGQSIVTATLSAPSVLDTTITLAFTGTALNNKDYTRTGAQIVILAGQTTGSITLTAKQDALVEGPETIVIDISKVTNGLENGVQQQTVTIVDDDAGPQLLANSLLSPQSADAVFSDPNSVFWN